MNDPYQILGIPQDASEDEIKKAYKALSRKYHPDANINNPNKELAEEKFKQVQQAYSQIMDQKKHGYSGNSQGYGEYQDFGGFGGFGNFGDFGGFGNTYGRNNTSSNINEDDMHLQAAANYINSRHYAEALNVLNSMSSRSANWYYYSSLANKGVGNNVQALEHAKMAAQLEPDNIRFRQLVNTLEGGGEWYNTRQQDFGGMPSIICTNPLLTCCLANAICNLCCCGAGGNGCCY